MSSRTLWKVKSREVPGSTNPREQYSSIRLAWSSLLAPSARLRGHPPAEGRLAEGDLGAVVQRMARVVGHEEQLPRAPIGQRAGPSSRGLPRLSKDPSVLFSLSAPRARHE